MPLNFKDVADAVESLRKTMPKRKVLRRTSIGGSNYSSKHRPIFKPLMSHYQKHIWPGLKAKITPSPNDVEPLRWAGFLAMLAENWHGRLPVQYFDDLLSLMRDPHAARHGLDSVLAYAAGWRRERIGSPWDEAWPHALADLTIFAILTIGRLVQYFTGQLLYFRNNDPDQVVEWANAVVDDFVRRPMPSKSQQAEAGKYDSIHQWNPQKRGLQGWVNQVIAGESRANPTILEKVGFFAGARLYPHMKDDGVVLIAKVAWKRCITCDHEFEFDYEGCPKCHPDERDQQPIGKNPGTESARPSPAITDMSPRAFSNFEVFPKVRLIVPGTPNMSEGYLTRPFRVCWHVHDWNTDFSCPHCRTPRPRFNCKCKDDPQDSWSQNTTCNKCGAGRQPPGKRMVWNCKCGKLHLDWNKKKMCSKCGAARPPVPTWCCKRHGFDLSLRHCPRCDGDANQRIAHWFVRPAFALVDGVRPNGTGAVHLTHAISLIDLNEAISKLKDKRSRTLVTGLQKGESLPSIAKSLKVSPKLAKSIKAKALAALRHMLVGDDSYRHNPNGLPTPASNRTK